MASTITRRPPADAEAAALQTRCQGAGIICTSWEAPDGCLRRPDRHRRADLRHPVRRRHRQPDRQRQPARPRGDRQRHRPRVRRPRLPDPDRHVILRPHLRMPRHRTARRAVRGSALLRFPRQRGDRPHRAGVQRGEAAGERLYRTRLPGREGRRAGARGIRRQRARRRWRSGPRPGLQRSAAAARRCAERLPWHGAMHAPGSTRRRAGSGRVDTRWPAGIGTGRGVIIPACSRRAIRPSARHRRTRGPTGRT